MELLTKIWRWFTVADAPIARVEPAIAIERACEVCGDPATCHIEVVVTPKRTGSAHACSQHIQGVIKGFA